ncbi:hypothetical protein F511_26565 [Dorcoceras hygrometricum]|uniref:Uncharacterized protein n=1 Tax=Dorcoceras hygrometricum TaxID=472368 RepID=A0A2Z7CDQ8_9LAMI|nr:hypothetical protein F511_26565 [Dorcoceras hygrometricum]
MAKLKQLEHNEPAGTMNQLLVLKSEVNQLIQQEDFALITSRKIPAGSICLIPDGEPDASNSSIQSRATMNQLLLYISSRELQYPVARNPGAKNCRSSKAQQLKNESAAKQLTIYESWMSTAELNSNGENDKKPAKEKDTSTVPLSVLYRTILNGKNVVSNGINFYRGYICEGDAIEDECSRRWSL